MPTIGKTILENRLRYIILLLLVTASFGSFGQDVSFSQFYTNPIYLNPAFAGSIGTPRISMQYRDQWHSLNNAYSTYSAAADFPVKKLQGGIGVFIMNDAQANGIINHLQANFSYAVSLQVTKEFTLRGALQVGYNRNSLNAAELVFADNLDPNYGNHSISAELASLSDPNYSFLDFSTGVMMYSKRLFYGVAIHHLAEPQQSYYEGQSDAAKLPRKYTAHFGARLPVYIYGHNRKKFDISPQVIVQKQSAFQQFNYGLFATKGGITAGTWFRQNFGIRYDAVIFSLGFFKKYWQFTYSYDWTISGLRGDTGGTSEVSLSFLLGKTDKDKFLPFFNEYKEEFGVR